MLLSLAGAAADFRATVDLPGYEKRPHAIRVVL